MKILVSRKELRVIKKIGRLAFIGLMATAIFMGLGWVGNQDYEYEKMRSESSFNQ